MIMKLNWSDCFLTAAVIIMLISFVATPDSACGQEPNSSLEWNIKTSQSTFYPGEPVLLTLNISNIGTQEEKVNFGADGIEAFSMEIRNSNGIIVAKGDKIQRWGNARIGTLLVNPGKTSQKSIVLNQWCSTLLPPGQYQVICNIDYKLRSESKKIENSNNGFKAGPIHKTQLALEIQIIEIDKAKFKEILEALAGFEVKPPQSNRDWFIKRETAREMLALTESELAIPYQLQLLKVEKYTWRKLDAINSLVKSSAGTLEATNGLVQIIEDPSIYKEDVKQNLIDAVYRLRETGKAEIINATEDFVSKYKRPVIRAPMD